MTGPVVNIFGKRRSKTVRLVLQMNLIEVMTAPAVVSGHAPQYMSVLQSAGI